MRPGQLRRWLDRKAFGTTTRNSGVDVGDLNVAIRCASTRTRRHPSGTLRQTPPRQQQRPWRDPVTGFTVTLGTSQNDLSWSVVTNRTAYPHRPCLDSGFTSSCADISPGRRARRLRTRAAQRTYRKLLLHQGGRDVPLLLTWRATTGNGGADPLIRDDPFTDTDGVAPGSQYHPRRDSSVAARG